MAGLILEYQNLRVFLEGGLDSLERSVGERSTDGRAGGCLGIKILPLAQPLMPTPGAYGAVFDSTYLLCRD